jgi:uncharacterized protein (TIGR02391 family)
VARPLDVTVNYDKSVFWRKHLHLADVVSDLDVLVALEPDELGLRILQVLASWPAHMGGQQLRPFLQSALQGYGATSQGEEAREAIREAWAWLEGQALLIQDPQYYGGEMRMLSRKGKRLARDTKARRAFGGHTLPKEALHSNIREEVWALYHRGKYDTAVFEAMKAVEVAVRDAATLTAKDIGAPLMRKAFEVNSGALTDMNAVLAEREALSNLFAGAIGAYKNPHSHRNVVLGDPDEAAEIILLANHLLRIVDGRILKRMV